jgi:uncharacterized protein
MKASLPYQIKNQQLWLSAERCLFWEEEKSLIVSDSHFGKTGHFRKAGIAVPQAVYKDDLLRLIAQIQYFQPARLIFVGDLFHSRENKELEWFKRWRENFPATLIQLVKGNHDILDQNWYYQAGIEVYEGTLRVNHFNFIHDITQVDLTEQAPSDYTFSGHIHPGIRVNGLGRQSLSFPCFYFGRDYAVLPAFSRFTGLALIEPKSGEQVFAITSPNHRNRQMANVIQIH